MSKWLKINLNQNNYSPIGVKDIVSNKFDSLHSMLFESAKELALINSKDDDGQPLFLNEYSNDIVLDVNDNIIYVDENFNKCSKCEASYYVNVNDWKIIEVNGTDDDYLSIPSIICTLRHHVQTDGSIKVVRHNINLTPWWKIEYLSDETKRNNGFTTEILEKYPYNEIIYYDYINEKATLENRVETETRKINFKEISTNDITNITYTSVINVNSI